MAWYHDHPYLQERRRAREAEREVEATLQGVAAPFQTLANPLLSSLTAPATPVEDPGYWGPLLDTAAGQGEVAMGGAIQAVAEAPQAAAERSARGVTGVVQDYASRPWYEQLNPVTNLLNPLLQLPADAAVSQLPVAESAAEFGADIASAGNVRSQEARQNLIQQPENFLSWQSIPYYAQEAAVAVPQLAVTAAAARVNPLLGFGLAGGSAAGSEYAGERAEGRTPAQAQESARVAAAAESVGEIPIIGMFANNPIFKTAQSRLGRVVQGGAGEGLGESATETLNILQDIKEGENITLGDALTRIRDAGITGAAAGGPVAAFSPPPTPEPVRQEPGDTPAPTVMETGDKDFDEGQQVAVDILKKDERESLLTAPQLTLFGEQPDVMPEEALQPDLFGGNPVAAALAERRRRLAAEASQQGSEVSQRTEEEQARLEQDYLMDQQARVEAGRKGVTPTAFGEMLQQAGVNRNTPFTPSAPIISDRPAPTQAELDLSKTQELIRPTNDFQPDLFGQNPVQPQQQPAPVVEPATQEIPPTPTEAPADTLDTLAQPEQIQDIESRIEQFKQQAGSSNIDFSGAPSSKADTSTFTLLDKVTPDLLADPRDIQTNRQNKEWLMKTTPDGKKTVVDNIKEAVSRVLARLNSQGDSELAKAAKRLLDNPALEGVGLNIVEPTSFGKEKSDSERIAFTKEAEAGKGWFSVDVGDVTLRGMGWKNSGLDPVTILHEATHVATSKNIKGVEAGVIKDPVIVKAVENVKSLKSEFDKIVDDFNKSDMAKSDPVLHHWLNYGTKNTDEFVTVVFTEPKVRDYLRGLDKGSKPAVGILGRLKSAFMKMLRFSKLDKPVFERIFEGVDALVSMPTSSEVTPGSLKFKKTKFVTESTQPVPEIDPNAPAGWGGIDALESPIDMVEGPTSGSDAPTKGLIRKASGALLGQGAGLPTEIIQAKELSEGIKRRSDYEATVLANDLRKAMRKAKINTTEQINQVMEYARGVNTPIPDRVKKAVDNFRKRIDIQSVRIAKELGQVEQTNRVAEVRQILLNNVGSYISRAYEADFDKDFGKQSWEAYKQDPTQGRGRIVANAINAVVGDLGKLRTTLEGAAAEAQAKSQGGPQFTPGDMVDRNTLENAYGTYIGKAGAGVSRDQMVAELSQYLAQAQNVQTQAELAVRDMLGLMGSNSKVTNYVRNLRMDDRNLRERQKIRPEFRALWGEMVEPVSNLAITLTRASAVLSGLKSLNRLYSDKPEWFADTPSEKMSVQIPSNPMAYGALAGKYTSDYVYNAIAPASETTQTFIDAISKGDMRSAATAVRNAVGDAASKTTGFMKMMQVVFRPANWIYNSANILLIPMMGGHFNVLGAAKKTLETGTKFAGTNYRTTIDESMARDIERGLIDPSQTRTLSQEATQARREEFYRYKGKYGLHIKEGLKGIGRTVRELYETIEIGPKRYVADKNIEQVMAMFPDMPKEQAIREGIERTQLTTFAYNRVPEIFKLAEKSQLGYFLTYVADTYRIAGNSLVLAAKDAANGIKNGNAKQVQYGIQRLAGTAAATMATTAITQGIVSASAGMVNSLGQLLTGDEEEEWIKRESLPEYLRDKQYLSWQNEDGSFEYFDTSRFDPIDPSANKIRGIIEAIDYFASGDAEKGQEIIGRTVKGVWDDFTGLSPLARAITGKAPKAGIRYSTPNTYRELQEYVINTLGIDEATADLALGAVNQFTSGATSGIAKAMESGDESAIRQAMRTANFEMFKVDALEQIADREGQFFKNGQNEAYDQVRYLVRMQRNPSGLEDAYREAIENEREAFNKLSTKVKLAKIQGKEDSEIRQSLIQGGVPRTQVYKILNDEFEPKQIDFEPTIKAELEGTKSYEEKSKRRREMQERVNRLNEIRNSYKETK